MKYQILSLKTEPYFWGAVASTCMAFLYFGLMIITGNSLAVIWNNFAAVWYLMIVIIIGFGIQIGLFVNLRNSHKKTHPGVTGVTGVAGGASGTAMASCCAHHIVDILPMLGLSGVAVFLVQYQKSMLVLGAAINMFGIAYMLREMQK